METGIWESSNTIKNAKCYRNVFLMDEEKWNQPRTNEQNAATLLSDILLGLLVRVSDMPQ